MSKLPPRRPAKINLKNIKSFITGYARKFSSAFGLLEDYKQEQVIWRETKAQECVTNKACIYCGCDMPAKLYSDEPCEDPIRKCYPAMMTKEEWQDFKTTQGIEIKID